MIAPSTFVWGFCFGEHVRCFDSPEYGWAFSDFKSTSPLLTQDPWSSNFRLLQALEYCVSVVRWPGLSICIVARLFAFDQIWPVGGAVRFSVGSSFLVVEQPWLAVASCSTQTMLGRSVWPGFQKIGNALGLQVCRFSLSVSFGLTWCVRGALFCPFLAIFTSSLEYHVPAIKCWLTF